MFENSIRLATCDSGLKFADKIWVRAQQAKSLPVVAIAELAPVSPVSLACPTQPG